jgi:hypothetical protein
MAKSGNLKHKKKIRHFFMFKGKKCYFDPNLENLGRDLMPKEAFGTEEVEDA